jgi:hypothetical protein
VLDTGTGFEDGTAPAVAAGAEITVDGRSVVVLRRDP